jgi:hypothetical protein
METAPLVLCERAGKWALACRRAVVLAKAASGLDLGIRIVETRSATECRQVLKALPVAFAALELTPSNADQVLELLSEIERTMPNAAAAILADRSMHSHEWAFRECGAVHWVASPRRVVPLVLVAQRHAARFPAPPRSLAEQIRDRLPWSD